MTIRTVSIREARQKLRSLLADVCAGEEIVLARRGKPVARLVPIAQEPSRLPSLADFRRSVVISGSSLREEVIAARTEARC